MSVLRVVITRTGGFAGTTRRAEVDDPDRAEQLSAAVRASAGQADGPARDAFTYEFAVVTTTTTERVDLGESAMDAALRRAVHDLFAP